MSSINHFLSRLNGIILVCLASKKGDIPADYYRNVEYHKNKPLIVQKYLKFSQICCYVNQSPSFSYFIFGAILVSAILIGLDTYISSDPGSEIIKNLDIFVLSIFFLECFIKICMEGLAPWTYFIGPDYAWNLFDFSIIILSVSLKNAGAILRLLRLARLAKLARYIPSLRMIINGFVVGVASVLPIFLLLVIAFYVFGMIGYNLFSANDPFHFGTLEMSMLSLFRLCIYDNAQDLMYLNTFGCGVYPDLYVNDQSLFNSTNSLYWCENPSTNYIIAPIFFILFILIAGFMILSLFVGAVALSMSLSLRELEMTEREKLRKKRFNSNLKRLKIIRFNHDTMYNESGKDWMEIDSTDNDSTIFSIDTHSNSRSDLLDSRSNHSNPFTRCYSRLCKMFEPDYTLQMIFLKATLGNSLAVAMGWKDRYNHKIPSSDNQISSQLGSTVHNDFGINSNNDDSSPQSSSVNSSRNLLGVEQVVTSSSSVKQKTGHSSPLRHKKSMKALLSFSQETQDVGTATHTNAKPLQQHQSNASEKSLYFIEGEILGVIKSRPFYIHYYLLLTIQCHEIVNHSKFAFLTVAVISTGLVVAGVATDPYLMSNPSTENAVNVLDSIILAFFVIEIVLKVISCGFQPWIYFNSLWNITDTIIVIASFIPASHFLVFIFRILLLQRIVKLVNQFPELVIIVNAIGISFLTVGYIALILFLIFYVFGILGVILFSDSDPWHFGQLHTAFLTLFRALILDNVFELIYTNFYGCDVYPGVIYALYPEDCKNPVAFSWLSVLYYLSFVIVGVFVLLTLFIGVISTSLENAQLSKRNDTKLQLELKRHANTLCLSPERLEAFRRVFKVLDLDENGMLEEDELHMGLEALCLDISDEIFDECINRVDPDREGLNQLAFLNFMSMLPSYRKSMEHVLQYSSWFIDINSKKNRSPDANIFVKISYGIQDLLDKVLGQAPESIIAKQTNAALTIQEFWQEYKKHKKEKQKLRNRRRKSTLNQHNDEEGFFNVFRWSNPSHTNRLISSSNSENNFENTENAATFLLQEKFRKALNTSNNDISEQKQKPCGIAENSSIEINEVGNDYHKTDTFSAAASLTKNTISQVSKQVTLQSTQFLHHLASPPDSDHFNYTREAVEMVDNAKQHQHHVNSSSSSRKENKRYNTNDNNIEQEMNQKIISNVRLKPLHPTEFKPQANKVYVDNTFASFKKDRCQKSEVDSIDDHINKSTDTTADSKTIHRNYVDDKDMDYSQQHSSKFHIFAADAKVSNSRNVILGKSVESKMFKQSSSSGI